MSSDTVYSFSRLNSFWECSLAFKYNYEDNLEGEANFFNEMGSLCHIVLELYDRGKITDPLKAFQTGYVKRVRDHEEEWHENWYLDCYKFFRDWKGHDNESIWIEEHGLHDFGFKFQGYVDRMYKDDRGYIIQDYKISKPFAKKDRKAKTRQLYLYSSFVKERFGEFPACLSFFHFRQNKVVEIEFNHKDYLEAVDWATECVRKIEEKEDHWTKDGYDYFCQAVCSFRNICEIKY